jgi:hypothetical protein
VAVEQLVHLQHKRGARERRENHTATSTPTRRLAMCTTDSATGTSLTYYSSNARTHDARTHEKGIRTQGHHA